MGTKHLRDGLSSSSCVGPALCYKALPCSKDSP